MFAFANPNGEIEQELLKPTMTLNETNIYQIEVHSKIPEFKAIAKDSNGKELKVDIKHNINNAVLGTYKVTFKAVDQFDNEEIIEREFKVVDTTRPVIRLIGRQLVKRLIDYETYTDEGANVTDNYDAPTTKRGIQRGTNTVAGIYTLRYNHTDSSGNRAFEVVRSIKMLAHNDDEDGDGYTNEEEYNEGTNYDDPNDHPDYDKAPTIILDENNIYSIEVYTDIPEFKATATDVADGVVPVIITHDINKDVVANTYKVTFRAVDSLGNIKEIIRDFAVVDTTKPLLSLIGLDYIKVILGINPYTDEKATATDVADGVVPVKITHNINKEKSGTYKVVFKAVDSLGNVKTIEKEFKVNKRKISVEIDDKESIYGEPLKELTYTITTGTEVLPNAGIVLSKQEGINAGTYDISGTSSNEEYEVTFVNGTYTITKKTLEETDLPSTFKFIDGEFVYDKTEHKIEVSGLPADLTAVYDDNTRVEVGTQLVKATISGPNYEGSLPKTANLTVTKAPITYKIDNKTSVYKADLESLTGSITSGTVYDGDDLKIELSTTATSTSDVGTYTITGVFDNENYHVTFVPGKYTITAKNINEVDLTGITFEPLTTAYDKKVKTIVIGGVLPTDLDVNYTDNTRTDAGEQTAKATISGANYSGTVVKEALLKINKADIKFTADNQTSVYGEAIKALTYTAEGTNYGNEITPTLTKADGSNVGTYDIKITAVNANYNITLVDGTYTITKKTLEESDLGSAKFNDGEFTYNGEERSIVVEGLTGSGLTATYDDNTRKDVGSQTVTATISGPNYEGSLTRKAELKITERPITYKIGSKESIYKNPLVGLTGSIISGEVVSGDNLGVDLSTTATTTSNVGNYPITGTFTNTNYNVTFVPGTYTIKQKPIAGSDVTDILFTNKTVPYNGSEHKIEVTNLPADFLVSYSNNTRTIHGSQTATATITGNGNYSGTVTKTATLTVEKANYDMSEVKFNDKEVTYYGSDHEITITGTLPSGVTVSYENNIHTNAGTYPATAKFTSDNDNYNLISNMTANLIINKADPGVSPVTGLTSVKGKMLYSVELPSGYAYKNADSELTIAGYNTVPVIFTPADTDNYNTVETTATIYVKDIFTVTFKNGDIPLKTESVVEGENATAPASPTKEGYTFDGWDIAFTNVQSDLVVNAKWKVNKYTITFNTNGGSAVPAINQNYGTTITPPADPTKTGYTFAGWEPSIPSTMPANNLTINAKWTVNQYTITFNTDGGNAISPITQDFGTAITAPANPVKTNYTFVKWEPLIPSTMPANNLTVKAIWKANQTGIVVREKANVQLVFTQGQHYIISEYIDVFPKYADGRIGDTPIQSSDYTTTGFTTDNPGTKTLTVKQTSTNFTGTISYTVKADTAYQTKFEAIHTPNSRTYRATKTNGWGNYDCTSNCDSVSNTFPVTTTFRFLEVIEHYEENIKVSEVKVKYKNESNFGSPLAKIKNGNYDYVRYSKRTGSLYYDPVYVYQVDDIKEIDLVQITYVRAGFGTFTITFKYEAAGNLRAISEVTI